MTTISFTHSAAYFHNVRAPRTSFAARLAALQARHEASPHVSAALGVAARAVLAAIPFATLAWLFVTV